MTPFNQILERLTTEKVTIHYIQGGRDRYFGASYTAAFIQLDPLTESDEGIYYIQHLDQLFLKVRKNEHSYTKRLSLDQECSLPQSLMEAIEQVFTNKSQLIYKPDPVVVSRKKLFRQKTIRTEKPIRLDVDERFLELKGTRSTNDHGYDVKFSFR
jgi:hypothetical protein